MSEGNGEMTSLAWYTPEVMRTARDQWAQRGEVELDDRSWFMSKAGYPIRIKFSSSFADAVYPGINEAAAKRLYRMHLKDYGVPWALILLLASIAWDVLWYWWTHRKDQDVLPQASPGC